MAIVKAMVLRDNAPEIIIGTDHPFTRSLLAGRKPKVNNPTPYKVRAITRAQGKIQGKDQFDNIVTNARVWAVSKQVKLASPTSFHSEGQGKGKTPKQGLQFVVAGQLECSI